MSHPFNQRFACIQTLTVIITMVAITLFSTLLFSSSSPSAPETNEKLVVVNIASTYLHRLQIEHSIVEPTYFIDDITINNQLYKIQVMAAKSEDPNALHVTVTVFPANRLVEGVTEGYVDISLP